MTKRWRVVSFRVFLSCLWNVGLCVACLTFSLPVAAQTELAHVSGRITDPSGAVVVDAEVEIKSVETNVTTTIKTNQDAYAADKMPAGVQERKTDSGMPVLADAKGMTLYTFDKDMKGMSACSGGCAQNWPPLAAGADAKPIGSWTIVTRQDGSKQWAYKDKPLYTFVKDTKAGDAAGDGVGSMWHAAMP